jgi:hypothetical protein
MIVITNITVTSPDRAKDFEAQLQVAGSRAMRNAVLYLEGEVAKRTPVGVSGQLRQGIRGVVRNPTLGVVGATGPGAVYADIREFGRRPGKMPPPAALENWIRLTDRGRVFLKSIAAKYNLPPQRALKVAAFLKARAIGRRGYKGAFMFQKAEKAASNKVIAIYQKTMFQEMGSKNFRRG